VIRSAHIENFRCLHDLTLELGPLTVLVGPNASGKSAILHALDPTIPWNDANGWRHEPGAAIKMRVELTDGSTTEVSAQNAGYSAWLAGGLGGVPGAEAAE
jgi:predicted ATPase